MKTRWEKPKPKLCKAIRRLATKRARRMAKRALSAEAVKVAYHHRFCKKLWE